MTALLEVGGLSRNFGGLAAVSDVSFTVPESEILGLIGPNGAGKTTVVNLISGVIRPSAGRIVFAGRDVTSAAPHRLAAMGLVRTFQSTTVFPARTVRENALRGAYLHSWPGFGQALLGTAAAARKRSSAAREVEMLLEEMGLQPVANHVAGGLPYGFQKMLGIVIALAARPRLVMLDEPVAGLSLEEADQIRNVITRMRDRGVSVIVIDHNMRFISGLCDRLVVLHHGRELAQGSPQKVLSMPDVIAAYLGKRNAAPLHP